MTSISKNVYIDKLDDIANKYNNIYHSTIKMKPLDVKSNTILTLLKGLMIKILNLKLMILLEYENIKRLLQLGLEKFWRSKKLKTLCCGHTLKAKKLLERFTKKNYKKQIKKSLELKK